MRVKEALTPAEERFERLRKKTGLLLGPAVFVLLYLFPPGGLPEKAQLLAAITGLTVVFWMTEAVPMAISAVLAAVLSVALGVASPRDAFEPFANPIIFLFIGSFIIAESAMTSGLDRRIAAAVLSVEFFRAGPARRLVAVGLVAAFISMWMSNTAAAAIMLPIAAGLLGEGGGRTGGRAYAASMMLMVAYAASVGGLATPVGTPPNLIGIGLIGEMTGVRIGFFQWMLFALPLAALMFAVLCVMLAPMGRGRIAEDGAPPPSGPARWSRAEINTAAALIAAVALWIAPSAASVALGGSSPVAGLLGERLNEGVAAMLAASLLFVLPVSAGDGEVRMTMTWERAARIDWGTILLFGGGLCLGKLMLQTGLAGALGAWFTGAVGVKSLWGVTAVSTVMAIALSELTSNTASANMVIPLAIASATAAGVAPVPAALGACLGSSFGFMLPVSTPPNAIVYGSGLVPVTRMASRGIVFDACGFALIMGWLMVVCPLMGWT